MISTVVAVVHSTRSLSTRHLLLNTTIGVVQHTDSNPICLLSEDTAQIYSVQSEQERQTAAADVMNKAVEKQPHLFIRNNVHHIVQVYEGRCFMYIYHQVNWQFLL